MITKMVFQSCFLRYRLGRSPVEMSFVKIQVVKVDCLGVVVVVVAVAAAAAGQGVEDLDVDRHDEEGQVDQADVDRGEGRRVD